MMGSSFFNVYPGGSRVPSSLAELPESMFVTTVGSARTWEFKRNGRARCAAQPLSAWMWSGSTVWPLSASPRLQHRDQLPAPLFWRTGGIIFSTRGKCAGNSCRLGCFGRLMSFAKRQLELRPLALGLHFGLAHSGFELQKGQLLVGEFFASRAIFFDPRQAQQLAPSSDRPRVARPRSTPRRRPMPG
jgi:hypothetical protein